MGQQFPHGGCKSLEISHCIAKCASCGKKKWVSEFSRFMDDGTLSILNLCADCLRWQCIKLGAAILREKDDHDRN